MSRRVSPTERIRAEIDSLLHAGLDLAAVLEQVARVGTRLIMQVAMESEVRGLPCSVAVSAPSRVGAGRSGLPKRLPAGDGEDDHWAGRAATAQESRAAGPVTSGLFGPHPCPGPEALEALVIAGFVRGLSVRDVEKATGQTRWAPRPPCPNRPCRGSARPSRPSSTPGHDAASMRWCWTTCSWTPHSFRMHAGARAEPVLAAWGITTEGKPALDRFGRQRTPSPPMRGQISCPTSTNAGCAHP